jgi:hypothetical protein
MSKILHVGFVLKNICFAGVLGKEEHRIPLAPVCPPRPHGFGVRRSEFGGKSHWVGAFDIFAFVVCNLSHSTSTSKHSGQDGGNNNQSGGVYSLPIEILLILHLWNCVCL